MKSIAIALLTGILIAPSLSFSKGATAICRHQDDDRLGAHTVTLCNKRIPGHEFKPNDTGNAVTCEACEKAHPESPNLCKITQIPLEDCSGRRSSSEGEDGYTPQVIDLRRK